MSQALRHARLFPPPAEETFATEPLQDSLLRRLVRMAKAPTTTPRIVQYLTYSGLAITILAAAISYGRSADKIEKASKASEQVPVLQTTVNTLSTQMSEIKELIKSQGEASTKERETWAKEITSIKQSQTELNEKVNALTSTNGSAWALAQSTAIKVGELKGTLEAMQRYQTQQKEK